MQIMTTSSSLSTLVLAIIVIIIATSVRADECSGAIDGSTCSVGLCESGSCVACPIHQMPMNGLMMLMVMLSIVNVTDMLCFVVELFVFLESRTTNRCVR